jgi:hypothetical protein
MPWAKVPIRFLGDGSHYIPGVPADPDHTLYATEERAAQIEASGLYERATVPTQEHGLGAAGRHLVCKCGFEAATTPEFQSHLHENGIS